MPHEVPSPPSWRNHRLTDYFQMSHENRYATLENFSAESAELIELDTALHAYWGEIINPRPRSSADLLMRAYLLFVGTCEMAFSTQQYTSIVIARAALEAAGYANFLATDSEAEQIWLERDESIEKKKKCRNYFTNGKVLSSLLLHSSDLAHTYSRLYETAIDFGAHPNISGIVISSREQKSDDGMRVEQVALTNDPDLITFGLKTAFDVGLCIAGVSTFIFADQQASKRLSEKLHLLLEQHNARIQEAP